jgi:hypothetical protein
MAKGEEDERDLQTQTNDLRGELYRQNTVVHNVCDMLEARVFFVHEDSEAGFTRTLAAARPKILMIDSRRSKASAEAARISRLRQATRGQGLFRTLISKILDTYIVDLQFPSLK